MNRRTPLASALLALFSAPAAWAQASEAATPIVTAQAAPAVTATAILPDVKIEQTRDRDSFVSAPSLSKLPGDLRDIPQSVTVINKALLQTQGASSLADALRNVPGITLGGAEGG